MQEMRKKKRVTSITPPQTRNMISPQKMSLGDKTNVTITPPSNVVQYCKSEVVNELRKYKKGSKEIDTTMMIMINMCYVPCGLHTLRCMMKIDTKGKPTPDTPWSTMRGRKPIASLEDVQAIAEDLEAQSGRGWSYGDTDSKLVEIKSKKMKDEGYAPLTTPTADKKTVRNYTALIAHQTNM
jgi:hypothetical protein